MKNKSLAGILATILIIGLLGTFAVSASPATTVEVVPKDTAWAEPENKIGDTFTISITVKDVENLNAWSAGMRWDPNILQVTAWTWGEFKDTVVAINSKATTIPMDPTIDNTAGYFTKPAAESATEDVGVTATSIVLLTVTFSAIGYAYPETISLELIDVGLKDPAGAEISFTLVHGTFLFAPEPNIAPVASFTWTPTVPIAGVDEVTFDASASYDPDGIGIASMTFDFGDGTSPVTLSAEPWVTTHLYADSGTYPVTLTVWDKGKLPYYSELSTIVTQDITVVPPAPPSGVDVFTIKSWLGRTTLYRERGTGPIAPGSAFAPGETVTLRGYVYYEDIPMMAVNVGFQVNDPDALPYTSRAASTDVDGNATISLRLPMVPKFGSYGVVATARVFEMDMSDTLEFEVGWLIEISVTAPDYVERGTEGTFTVTVTNIDPYDAYPVLLTISVSDKIGQVLNAASKDIMVAPGTAPETLAVDIPTTAIPGFGAEVEANAYTDWLAAGGTAYCPPATDTFEIT